jgi:hypothetical protein
LPTSLEESIDFSEVMPIYDTVTKELDEWGFNWVCPTSLEPEPLPDKDTFLSSELTSRLDPSQAAESTTYDLFYGGTHDLESHSDFDFRKLSDDFESDHNIGENLLPDHNKPIFFEATCSTYTELIKTRSPPRPATGLNFYSDSPLTEPIADDSTPYLYRVSDTDQTTNQEPPSFDRPCRDSTPYIDYFSEPYPHQADSTEPELEFSLPYLSEHHCIWWVPHLLIYIYQPTRLIGFGLHHQPTDLNKYLVGPTRLLIKVLVFQNSIDFTTPSPPHFPLG